MPAGHTLKGQRAIVRWCGDALQLGHSPSHLSMILQDHWGRGAKWIMSSDGLWVGHSASTLQVDRTGLCPLNVSLDSACWVYSFRPLSRCKHTHCNKEKLGWEEAREELHRVTVPASLPGATADGTLAGTDREQVSLKAKGQKAKFSGDLEHMTLEEREGGLMGNHSLKTGWASTTRHDLRQVTQPPGAPVSPSERMMEKITLPRAPGRNNNEVLCWRNQRGARQRSSVTPSKWQQGPTQRQGDLRPASLTTTPFPPTPGPGRSTWGF